MPSGSTSAPLLPHYRLRPADASTPPARTIGLLKMPTKEELINAFKSFDLNRDGVITQDEFVHVLCTDFGDRGAPLPVEAAKAMFRNADRDGDGIVSFEEFALVWAEEKRQQIGQAVDGALAALEAELFPQYHSMEQAFASMDANGDGVVSRAEFASTLKAHMGDAVSDEEAMLLASKYDLNGDGIIDYSEFEGAMGPRGAAKQASKPKRSVQFSPPPAQPPPPPDARTMAKIAAIEANLKTKLEEKYSNLRTMFRGVDENGSGTITREEFKKVFDRCHIPVTPEHMQLLVERFDKDGNNAVDFNEFCRWMAPGYFEARTRTTAY
jgi:Ca2+-binding EF-hand superfamily protein